MNYSLINEKLAKAKAQYEWLETLSETWNSSLNLVKETYSNISLQDGDLAEKYKQEIMACLNIESLEVTEKVRETPPWNNGASSNFVNISPAVLPEVSKTLTEVKNNIIPLEIKPPSESNQSNKQSEEKPTNKPENLPPLKQQLGSVSGIKFNAAIGLDTLTSKALGNIVNDYPITIKEKTYASAWDAVKDELVHDCESLDDSKDFQLIKEVLSAKLEQYPAFVQALTRSGGVDWIGGCSYFESDPTIDQYWQGVALESGFIRALIVAYQEAIQNKFSTEINNNVEEEYSIMNDRMFYEPLGKNLKIAFSSFELARKWGRYLKENFACESYTFETSETDSDRSRILKAEQVTSDTVDYLVQSANFAQEPGENNPLPMQQEYA